MLTFASSRAVLWEVEISDAAVIAPRLVSFVIEHASSVGSIVLILVLVGHGELERTGDVEAGDVNLDCVWRVNRRLYSFLIF